MSDLHRPVHPVRLVTASALFDGHDASINIMRRILQSQGAEVIHLGHNRSVREVVDAALEEDAHGVAVSSYQGGHVEYFEYLVESLRSRGARHIRVVGGGGGVIVPEEITRLRDSGVTIFSPEDGQRMGLAGMVNSVVRDCDFDLWDDRPADPSAVLAGDRFAIARAITGAELGKLPTEFLDRLRSAAAAQVVPVLGITGTGGSGKSSLTDELVRRLRVDQQDKLRIAVIAVDPTRRRGGGALLGDRIRMNSLDGNRVFFRSLATRGSHELPEHLSDVIDVVKAAGFDLVIVETPGIGQGDAAIVPYVDTSLYVMTPEFGAASQLEKIDMLDFADVVAINKFERRGAQDALRDVGRQLVRNREAFGMRPEEMPVYGTSAATFNDDGVTALYQHLKAGLAEKGLPLSEGALAPVHVRHSMRHPAGGARGPGALPRRDHRHGPRLPRRDRPTGGCRTAGATPGGGRRRPRRGRLRPDERAVAPRGRPQAAPPPHHGADRELARRRRLLLRGRAGGEGPGPGDRHPPDPRVPVRQQGPTRRPAPVHRPRGAGAVLARGEPARSLPLHGRGVPLQTRR